MAGGFVDISSNAAAVSVRYDQAPKLIASNIVKIFRQIGAGLQAAVVRDKLSGRMGQSALARRTGTLARAIFYKITLDTGDSQDAVLVLGADRKKAAYAAAQEYGATITPKHGRYLTVPIGPALTAKGVARVSAREFISNPQSLGFESSFVNRAKTAILGRREDGQVEPVFALKARVVIPERSYLRSTVTERCGWIREQLGLGAMDGVEESL
jgi:hypothetical protein